MRAEMLARKPTGRGASAIKYDLLTAMGTYGLAQGKSGQVLIFRLITLITARYNWQRDELTVGQREIARMWNVDERTVKREMAKLRAKGWLTLTRQGARGRVSEYALNFERIIEDTEPQWAAVGPDFDHRMRYDLRGENLPEQNVVPLRAGQGAPAPDTSDGSEWSLAKAVLHREDGASYASWIATLERSARAGGRLTLRAPSRFHANYVMSHLRQKLLLACRDVDSDITDVIVTD